MSASPAPARRRLHSLGRALRRTWPLTPRGVGAVVIGIAAIVCAHAFGVVELVYVGVLLLLIVALGWVSLWFVHRYGEVSRSFSPDVAAVGTESVARSHDGPTSCPTAWRARPPGSWPAPQPSTPSG